MKWETWELLTPKEKEEYDFKFGDGGLAFHTTRMVIIPFFFILLLLINLVTLESVVGISENDLSLEEQKEARDKNDQTIGDLIFIFLKISMITLVVDVMISLLDFVSRQRWLRNRLKVKRETVVERVEVKE